MDLALVFWKAIHSDKVVDSKEEKAYTKVNRATLQKLVFYDDVNATPDAEFKRPEGVNQWPIRWRLRSVMDFASGSIKERNWIIDDGKFNILNKDLELSTFSSNEECERKPISVTPVDLL